MLSILGVALIHVALGWALLAGLNVDVRHSAELITRMVEIDLPPPPPPPPPPPVKRARTARAAAAPAAHDRPGGSTGPERMPRPTPVAPVVAKSPTPSPGGSSGHGTAIGSGSGGGTGGRGTGNGDGDGGTDLEQIAGEIRPSDYPKAALKAGIGGRVEFRFTVAASGRVSNCAITRSSGNAELDATTCRVIIQRFRYRPSTDAAGRPRADEVEGDHLWSVDRREESD
ncbi:MAG: energy transducer TonB [Sphingomicrobium sp.]